ncbi:hypothetical protein B7494_g6594 [Chlorociboria aeruginascens]|nr:hypothetical protein B7494_g6594 [Chlorociboria aeruginascens]
MSFFCSSPSKSGPLISKLAPRQALSFLYPLDSTLTSRRHSRLNDRVQGIKQMVPTSIGLERWFINSLANAGQCQKHRPRPQRPSTFFTSQRPYIFLEPQQKFDAYHRQQHTKVDFESENYLQVEPAWTKEELMALVDDYGGPSFTDQLPLIELPQRYQPSDGPYITVSDNIEDEWPPPHRTWFVNSETRVKIKALEEALKDFHKDPEEIYELYRELPEPRVPYLEAKTRHKLLRHISIVEKKDEHSMLRYLSVIDDMKVTAIPLSVNEWTSTISFVARYVQKSTEIEVEAALHMWREMEQTTNIKGNYAAFNVLFDVACKSGKFTLAEMIYKEMVARGLEFNRFHHVSLIYFQGLKGNGDGARAAYKDLVDAGEIVDTVVLNAVISALIRAKEPSAAENVYERMKKIHIERVGSRLAPRNYKHRRQINMILMNMARASKANPSKRAQFQDTAIIAPDLHTYRILVNHAMESGDLHKTVKFLDEMKWFAIPLHGALFLALLKGFALHGGIRYTHWTQGRLEGVWTSFLEAIDNDVEDLYISRWIVTWALKAFITCSNQRRTIHVWEALRARWDPSKEDLDFVMITLNPILEGRHEKIGKRYDWTLGSL